MVTGDYLCFGWKTLRMSWGGGMSCWSALAPQTESAFPFLALDHAAGLIHPALPGNLLKRLDAHSPRQLQAALCLQRLQRAQGLPACPEGARWQARRRMGCGQAQRLLLLSSGHLAPRWWAALCWDRLLACPCLYWTSPICLAPSAAMEPQSATERPQGTLFQGQ